MELLDVETSRNTIILDFDGVLHNLVGGWKGPDIFGDPVPGALEFVLWLKERGYNMYILSARAAHPGGIEWIKEWLKENRFPELEVTDKKIGGCLYVDDRCFRFEGNFEKVIDFLVENPKPGRWGMNVNS